MSYILDALRRAEVERARERGKVPGVHDPAPAAAPASAPEGGGRRIAWAGGAAVVVLAAVVLVWVMKDHGDAAVKDHGDAPVVASAGPAAVPAPAPVVPVVPQATAPMPVPVAPDTQPLAVPSQPAPAAQTAPRELAPVPALPHVEAPRAAVPAAPPAASSASARIYEASELPEDVRRALPPLSFGGAMYSDSASARLLIVNGQVLHEGDPVAKGLVLEQIRLKTAVLSFRGYRYLVSY